MSACGDFAEHVWKPGSCKNCFHQLSAHTTSSRPGGAVPVATCLKSGGDDDDAVTVPSPYSKPTIAVKPTMMSLDTGNAMADVNMNIETNTKSPVERLGLKKILDLSSLYIDGDNCNKSLRDSTLQSLDTKTDFYFSSLSKETMLISNMLVTQDQGTGLHNSNGDTCRQQNSTTSPRTKSTYNPSATGKRANFSPQKTVDNPFPVNVGPASPAKAYSNGISCGSTTVLTTKASMTSSTSASSLTSSLSVGALNNSQPSIYSPPVLSKLNSPLDDDSSLGSSTDSLPVTEGSVGSPQSPLATGNSVPGSPSAPESEPIYAESTKKKRRPLGNGAQCHLGASDRTNNSEHLEGQRTTITVIAAHMEENNRTFYLSSPDSAVSTHCQFSPTARKDTSGTAFRWPSPSRSAPSLVAESSHGPALHPKPQSSPPIPPKRTTRSPKLGTSSLSPSVSSPVPLPDLPRLGSSCLSPSLSSPVPLPELSMLFLVSAKEGHFKVQPENHNPAAFERWNKNHHHGSAWNCRIDEEEEEEERERKESEKKTLTTNPQTTSRVTGPVNSAAVWKESRVRNKALTSPPPTKEPGTTPPLVPDNGACQTDGEAAAAEEDAKQSRSMPAKQHESSMEPLAVGKQVSARQESNPPPPPPPPKKQHRASGHLSSSNMELNRCVQIGSHESPVTSLRDLGNAGLPTASTDSLTTDLGSRDGLWLSCSSPFQKSPVPSTPCSPRPPTFSISANQPPPLPEKKMVNRTVSAPDSATTKAFVRAYPRLPFTGSETNVCRPNDSSCRASLPSSPVDSRPVFSSNESLENCHAPLGRPSRTRTSDEPFKNHGRLGVHCRSSITCSSSPQLSAPFSASEAGPAPNLGSGLQLQTLLSNIDSREGVYSKLGGLYAESLRRLALKCEEHFTSSQRNRLRFEESNWSLFRLTSNKPSCDAGDAVYYSAACASDPSNSYAVKICKSPSPEAKQGHLYGLSVQQSMPPHFNLQQDCGHFLACVPQSMLPSDLAPSPTSSPRTRRRQAERERVVVIAPEIPRQTAADFVREFEAFHKSQPEVYERRVCFLLLQLCHGLEHLKEHGVTHRHLCLENLLLVPHPPTPSPQQSETSGVFSQRQLPRLLISNFAKAKRRSAEDAASSGADPRVKRDHARLAPEIVSAAQYRKFDEFQTGILIYELLHQPNPFEVSPALKEQDYRCEDLPSIPAVSLYSAGLQRLARLLLQPDPIKRIHIQDAKRILQSLLWGPRKDLMDQRWDRNGPGGREHSGAEGARREGLLNWLDVKRALLMMKFAERSLEPERDAELEDWLCCRYFSSAHPLALCHTAELLYSLN
ncbi:inactive tyrosine-protein kinase PRAG1 [Corythoichthys intestinalis]|uniref:inactive tyrosine-protein kinase PRAG1 n=1 Tax=Corythoichthys intestinalis TaxID=161448 RepID=UPI0025A4DF6F|nr:inactive tyrosine-protein kinase PRAG1 [Corythoichthys intestinalis]XP_061800182.1 inactive tyrosine-protein kinase PRAG1-like [Nerophis lumbriciformis]